MSLHTVTSLQDIIDEIDKFPHVFDLDQDSLGLKVAVAAAGAIETVMDSETDPNGMPWIPLDPEYEAWKEGHYPGRPMAVLLERMKDIDELTGELYITADTMRQQYGLSGETQDLAQWFQDPPQMKNQPPRVFYELGQQALDKVDEVFDRNFDTKLP